MGPRRLLLVTLAWAGGLLFAWLSFDVVSSELGFGVDSHAYWAAWRGEMYDAAPATRDAYLYSPAFAQAIRPLVQLPWPVFGVVWSVAAAVTICWLAAGAGRAWAVPLALLGTLEVLTGNVNWLLALAAVLGLRLPGLWVVPLLTKVTPALGPIWFLARGEWRKVAAAAAWTAGVVVVSVVASPDLWRQWLDFLSEHAGSSSGDVGSTWLPPLVIRLPLALALVAWGARTDRVWTLPVAMVLSSPVSGAGQLVVLLAIPRLRPSELARRVRTSRAPTDGAG